MRQGLVGLVLLLSACSFFQGEKGVTRNRANDYHTAKEVPPLAIPANVPVKARSHDYDIPALPAGKEPRLIDDPVPPGIQVQ